MSEQLKVGDILKIKRTRGLQVVVKSGMKVDRAYDGCYYCYTFSTVGLPKEYPRDNKEVDLRTLVDPKVHNFYYNHYSMRGDGKGIDIQDVKVIGNCKLKSTTSIVYDIKDIEID